ncbi:MAG: exodeoxyribonuclease 7 large subunit [Oligoflexia bacterium]|nr:MAG: exodeoxyribonuclease 7 large subunit [Oligoflexia bacterium]
MSTETQISLEKSESQVLTVEQLNREVRQLIEGNLSLVWVQGEISNFKAHTSGHFYFSLKDEKSQIRAVMFRGSNARLRFKPTDGLEVLVRGRISVYEPRGEYQIVCETMEPVGAGALQKAFEQLKEKLKKEGLFDAGRKRPIPLMPRHVAIVTSPTGAAIRDMINVISRRSKSLQVTLVPTLVQGEAAAPQICEALKKAIQLPNVDAIIIGRGGGSMEDLWAFNDEKLARMIAASPVPIISAVGHEVDFTISDFVADLRAPTPSAAAELVVKNTEDLAQRVRSLQRMLTIAIQKHLRAETQKWKGLSSRLIDPKRRLMDLMQRNDELLSRLQGATLRYFEKRQLKLQVLQERMPRPDQVIQKVRNRIELIFVRMANRIQSILQKKNAQLQENMSVLDSLSPLQVLERGYSMTQTKKGIVYSASDVKVGEEIYISLMKGSLRAEVKEINQKESLWTLKKD